jgi:transglutaminase-like putative cysteine protease
MQSRWYIANKNQRTGPLLLFHLQNLADTGRLKPDDLVLPEGESRWVLASTIDGLVFAPLGAGEKRRTGVDRAAAGPRQSVFSPVRMIVVLLLLASLGGNGYLLWEKFADQQGLVDPAGPRVLAQFQKKETQSEVLLKRRLDETERDLRATEKRARELANLAERLERKIKDNEASRPTPQPDESQQLREEVARLKSRVQALEEQGRNDSARIAELTNQLAETKSVRTDPAPAKRDSEPAEKTPATEPAVAKADFKAIDEHALTVPKDVEASISKLAKYLVKPATNDLEKTRAIFRWITDRIEYDAQALFSRMAGGPPSDCSVETVMRTRKTVCEGYANLFNRLCREVGLQSVKISGASKGFGYVPGQPLKTDHAWNAVKIDGKWFLLDATWGAGHLDSKTRQTVKKFNEYYFLTPPEGLILDHYPQQPRWQLINPPIGIGEYQKWPKVATDLMRLGFPLKEVYAAVRRGKIRAFADAHCLGTLHVYEAPMQKYLSAGRQYRFRVEAPDCLDMAIINAGKFTFLSGSKSIYEGIIDARPGELKLAGKFPGKGDKYWHILEYTVQQSSAALPGQGQVFRRFVPESPEFAVAQWLSTRRSLLTYAR